MAFYNHFLEYNAEEQGTQEPCILLHILVKRTVLNFNRYELVTQYKL